MKSETLIRIKESRNKYLQEMKNCLTDKNKADDANEPILINPKFRKRNSMVITLPISTSDIYMKKAIARKVKVLQLYPGQFASNLLAVKNSVKVSVNHQSEKVKDRLTSLMMVLFD